MLALYNQYMEKDISAKIEKLHKRVAKLKAKYQAKLQKLEARIKELKQPSASTTETV